METVIDSQHGTTVLLAGIAIVLVLNLVVSIGKFFVQALAKKSESNDHHITKIDMTLGQVNESVKELRLQIGHLDRELVEVRKFKSDSQKLFSAIKILAGEDWPKVRKGIEDDALPK